METAPPGRPPASGPLSPPQAAGAAAAAPPTPPTGRGRGGLQDSAETVWLQQLLQVQPWESEGQRGARRHFLQQVVARQQQANGLDIDQVRLLSALYHSVRYLGCTYSPELEALLMKYDPRLAKQVAADRAKEAQRLRSRNELQEK